MAITNNFTKNTPTDRSQSFTYDVLNRIATAGTVSTSGANCWGEKYGYDAWGNLLSMAGVTPQYDGCSQESGFRASGRSFELEFKGAPSFAVRRAGPLLVYYQSD